jgi:hypothetical protein
MFGQLLLNKNKISTVRIYDILQTLPFQTLYSLRPEKHAILAQENMQF